MSSRGPWLESLAGVHRIGLLSERGPLPTRKKSKRQSTGYFTKPSMRGALSSEAVQILCRRAPAHPLRRRLRSIWPISDLSADDSVCTPQHIL